jgi:ectoine hydroxylase-related dioxygenase (phytanoyl-CoA dioxygenase family)
MSNFNLSPEQVEAFHRDGYVVVRGLFDAEEMQLLSEYARADQAMQGIAADRADAQGNAARLALWNDAGDDLYGTVSRMPRIVEPTTQLLGREVYHWHHKMSMKEPFKGGAWEWHQDYGYWYKQLLFPDLLSAFIAIDPNTRENGCMQVIKGSHKMGRIEHGTFGDQVGADPARVAESLKAMELVHCEMEPGDTLFFHSNTLHMSEPNRSPNPRWSLICCYNVRGNDPIRPGHPPYSKLDPVSDEALRDLGRAWKAKAA